MTDKKDRAFAIIEAPTKGDAGVKAWASVTRDGMILQTTSDHDIAMAWFDNGAIVRPLQWAGLAAQKKRQV